MRPSASASFVRLSLDAPIMGSAASGLGVLAGVSTTFLAVANFWGESSLYSLDATSDGLRPRLEQRFATKAAHDWEVVPHAREDATLWFASEYDSDHSYVYAFNRSWDGWREDWPKCADGDAERCPAWARSGECERNRAFMHGACAASCGRCEALHGPLVAVQRLDGLGGTAARSFRVDGAEWLFVANYKAPPGQGVSAYERVGGSAHPWTLRAYLDVPGAGEATHCPIEEDGTQLLVFASWFANGTFATSSLVFAMTTTAAAATSFTRRQELRTYGSHDAECFLRGGRTYLLLGSGRHDSGQRDLPSVLYRYQPPYGFVVVQRVPTVGAHDFELLLLPSLASPLAVRSREEEADEELLVVVANGASWRAERGAGDKGEVCDASVDDVWRWDDEQARLVPLQQLNAGGCATFARAWRSGGRTLLALAVERISEADGVDPATHQTRYNTTYDASVAVYEWRHVHQRLDRFTRKGHRSHGGARSPGAPFSQTQP